MTQRIDKPNTEADNQLRQCIDNMTSFVMVAGAGSGKTTSLVKALDYIRNKRGEQLRSRRQKIACITYTTVAEQEILNDVNQDTLFHVSTIHSFLWQIIRPFQREIKDWVLIHLKEKIGEIKEKLKNGYPKGTRQTTKDRDIQDLTRYEQLLNDLASVKHFTYETASDYKNGKIGHSDLVTLVPELIQTKPLLQKIIVQKYPYIFVDESQDTLKKVVESLMHIDEHKKTDFCLGFFGDPMQKIFPTGSGEIRGRESWQKIVKKDNYRSSTSVLTTINNIRKGGDGLRQEGGRSENSVPVKGLAKLFILKADADRTNKILKVQQHIAESTKDQLWLTTSQESDLKILVLEHRMAAKRLGFENIFDSFRPSHVPALAESFSNGTSWALHPIQNFVVPITTAHNNTDKFGIIELLRQHCPQLTKEELEKRKITSKVLQTFSKNVEELSSIMKIESNTIRTVIDYLYQHRLITLDERILYALGLQQDTAVDQNNAVQHALLKYFDCSVSEMHGYMRYINEESPYSTQQSIKGAEFERVMVILDDEEGINSTQISYEKLFGIKVLSDTDKDHITKGNDSVLDRTRRLFYVCCSRARKDLAVLLFVKKPDEVINLLKNDVFDKEDIITEEQLN